MSRTAVQPITLERLERGLSLAALAVTLDGDVYLPIFRRMQAEVDKARRERDDMARARDLAGIYTRGGGARAMR